MLLAIHSIFWCGIAIVFAAMIYFVAYLWLRHAANKDEHYNPLDAVDQPTTRGNLYRGRLGIDDYRRYKERKQKRDKL